jgi:hypothetical protein
VNWFERLAEQRIKQAQRAGELDDLPGMGSPLPPDQFASLPPEMRLAARVLSNSGYVPEEVDLLKQLGDVRERLAKAIDPAEKQQLQSEYVAIELKANMAMERHRRIFK